MVHGEEKQAIHNLLIEQRPPHNPPLFNTRPKETSIEIESICFRRGSHVYCVSREMAAGPAPKKKSRNNKKKTKNRKKTNGIKPNKEIKLNYLINYKHFYIPYIHIYLGIGMLYPYSMRYYYQVEENERENANKSPLAVTSVRFLFSSILMK